MKPLSSSSTLCAKITYAAMNILNKNGGDMRYADVCQRIAEEVPLSDYEKEPTKSGYPRWRVTLQFMGIELKAIGWLVGEKGVWHLTEVGQSALKMPEEQFFLTYHAEYNKLTESRKENPGSADCIEDVKELPDELEDLKSRAISGIVGYITAKNPYEFQDLVAALLRAMGYYTPFVAPRGKDGGVDIVAYRDPLGTMRPQLKVQVKHYPKTPIAVDEIRKLCGLLSKDGECGLFVTSGSFTSEARREARSCHRPLRLIDIDEFIDLWTVYYDRVAEADKALLPITPIYFIKQ